ncbi:MAG: DUF4133 domain-containing protein [Chitinophagaceae bacterium]
MSQYNINKGIGRTVEFRGLKAQYLFIFAGGLLGVLVLVMVLYLAGVASFLCLFAGGGGSSLIVWKTFSLNGRFGEHGLMKLGAKKKHPRYIISRKPVYKFVNPTTKSSRP